MFATFQRRELPSNKVFFGAKGGEESLSSPPNRLQVVASNDRPNSAVNMVGMDEKDLQEMLANLRTRPSSPIEPESPELDNMMAEIIIVRLRAVSGPREYYSAEERASRAHREEQREDPDWLPDISLTPDVFTPSSEERTPTDHGVSPTFIMDEGKTHDVCANLKTRPSNSSENQDGAETMDRNTKELSRDFRPPGPGRMSFDEISRPFQDEQKPVSDPDEHISKKRKMMAAEDGDTSPMLNSTKRRSTEFISSNIFTESGSSN